MTPHDQLEKLEDPPIVEVVCGFFFEQISGLDPVALGAFWQERRQEYPRHQLLPAIPPEQSGPLGFTISLDPGIGALRTWLISQDDLFVLQIQQDRFYLNWRAQGREYPRFSDRTGAPGLLSRATKEFSKFSKFCAAELANTPKLTGIELAKIDQFVEGRHWKGLQDLSTLVPSLARVLSLGSETAQVSLRMETPRTDGVLVVEVQSAMKLVPRVPLLKLETRRIRRGSIEPNQATEAFRQSNQDLNAVFVELVPKSQHYRFRREWRP